MRVPVANRMAFALLTAAGLLLVINDSFAARPPGDANADGLVNGEDVGPFISFVIDPSGATPDDFCAVDLNEDTVIDLLDAQLLPTTILGPTPRVLTLTAPEVGIHKGLVPITWSAIGSEWQPTDTVRLEFFPDDGSDWRVISGAESLAYDAATFNWDTATSCLRGLGFEVRIRWNEGTLESGSPPFTLANCGTTYYVNDSSQTDDVHTTAVGNDLNDGLDPASPRASLHAIVDAYDLQPGDEILVDTGVYTRAQSTVIGAHDPGCTVRGSPNGTTLGLTGGIAVLTVSGEDTVVEDLRLCSAQEAMRITNGGHRSIIRRCHFEQVDVGVNVTGSNNCLVENCLILGNGVAINQSGGTQVISNTIAFDGAGSGIRVDYGSVKARNNIIVARGADGVCLDVGTSAGLNSNYNCLFATNGATLAIRDAQPIHSLVDWRNLTGNDKHTIDLDPMFQDAASGNYRLMPQSFCIDTADPAATYDVEPQPNGGRRNMGADGNTLQATTSPATRKLVLLSPIGGIHYGWIDITWAHQGTDWQESDTLRVEYSTNDGLTWSVVPGADALSVSRGTTSFNTTAIEVETYNRVRITWNEGGGLEDTGARFSLRNRFYVNDTDTRNDVFTNAPGSDFNSGLSPIHPRLSLASIMADYPLLPGQQILIDTGHHLVQNVIVTGNGAAGNPIVLRGSPFGTTLDAAGDIRVLRLDANHVVVEQLRMTGATFSAINLWQDHTLRNCVIFGCESGIRVYLGFGSTDNQVIDKTVIRDCSSACFVFSSGRFTLSSSILLADSGSCVAFFTSSGRPYGTLKNNILRARGAGTVCFKGELRGFDELQSDYNCLFMTDGSEAASVEEAPANLALGEWQSYFNLDLNSINADPFFVDESTLDYRLLPTSPLIDAGDPLDDFDQEPLPNGGRVNIGLFGNTTDAATSPATRSLFVTSPAAGALLTDDVPIRFRAHGVGWQPTDTISLEFSSDNGQNWQPVPGAGALPYGTQEFEWDTFSDCLAGAGFVIRAVWNEGVGVTSKSGAFELANCIVYYINDIFTPNDLFTTAAGSDANDGLTPATPKATLMSVLNTYQMVPGATVQYDSGTYTLSSTVVSPIDRGEPGKPVKIQGSPNGTTLKAPLGTSVILEVEAADIAVENLTFDRLNEGGIALEVNRTPRCEIRGCTFAGGSTQLRITNTTDCLVENNLMRNATDRAVYTDFVENLRFHNNTVILNNADGIRSRIQGSSSFANNIFHANLDSTCVVFDREYALESNYNCFFTQNGADVACLDSVHCPSLWSLQNLGYDQNSIDADPLLEPFLYNLTTASPCIDAGTNSVTGPSSFDVSRNPRRIEDPGTPDTGEGGCPVVDMGAFEFGDSADVCP